MRVKIRFVNGNRPPWTDKSGRGRLNFGVGIVSNGQPERGQWFFRQNCNQSVGCRVILSDSYGYRTLS
jgi:hypothetical protein